MLTKGVRHRRATDLDQDEARRRFELGEKLGLSGFH